MRWRCFLLFEPASVFTQYENITPHNNNSWILDYVNCPCSDLLLNKIKSWDSNTYEHSLRVAALSFVIGSEFYCLSGDAIIKLTNGAVLHDLGKITWPQDMIVKNPLNEFDRDRILKHTIPGAHLAYKYWPEVPMEVLQIILCHHERPRGGGYPVGFRLVQPHITIVSAADQFAAMTEHREYRTQRPKTAEEASNFLIQTGYPAELTNYLRHAKI